MSFRFADAIFWVAVALLRGRAVGDPPFGRHLAGAALAGPADSATRRARRDLWASSPAIALASCCLHLASHASPLRARSYTWRRCDERDPPSLDRRARRRVPAPRLRRDRPHLRLGHGLRRPLAEVLRLLVSAVQPARSDRRGQPSLSRVDPRRSRSLSMALVAFRNRASRGVGGRGGALRSALGAVGAVFAAAILGGVTVKLGNAPWATVAHWLVAMTLLALVATTAIRAGALGGASALVQRGIARRRRARRSRAAVLAILAVALGGLTAKYPGAPVGCTTVPLCGANPDVDARRRARADDASHARGPARAASDRRRDDAAQAARRRSAGRRARGADRARHGAAAARRRVVDDSVASAAGAAVAA